MITINNLSVSYIADKPILDSLNLEIPDNSIHGVVGLNGAGKTTLFNAIFGLKKPDNGTILFNNQSITKNDISYLPFENYFYPNITGREYLSLFRNPDFDADRWNALFNLPLDQIIDEYSSGMKKKLALMGVIRQNRQVVLLDEPFNGLDIEMCRIVRLILLKLKELNHTVIVSSHIIETLTNLCDAISYLEYGKIRFSKSKSEFDTLERDLAQMIDRANVGVIGELMK
jgi:ABC-2 type transport system ATP-binding protein